MIFFGHVAHNEVEQNDGDNHNVKAQSINKYQAQHKKDKKTRLWHTEDHFPLEEGPVYGLFEAAHVNHNNLLI